MPTQMPLNGGASPPHRPLGPAGKALFPAPCRAAAPGVSKPQRARNVLQGERPFLGRVFGLPRPWPGDVQGRMPRTAAYGNPSRPGGFPGPHREKTATRPMGWCPSWRSCTRRRPPRAPDGITLSPRGPCGRAYGLWAGRTALPSPERLKLASPASLPGRMPLRPARPSGTARGLRKRLGVRMCMAVKGRKGSR